MACPVCGSRKEKLDLNMGGKVHHGAIICALCCHFLRWVPKPENLERYKSIDAILMTFAAEIYGAGMPPSRPITEQPFFRKTRREIKALIWREENIKKEGTE